MKRQLFPYYGTNSGMSAGIEYAVAVAIFVGIGLFLDAWLGTSPVLVVVFAVIGFVAGFARLYYSDRYEASRRRMQGLPDVEQREIPSVLHEKAVAESSTTMWRTEHPVKKFGDWKPRRFGDPVPGELLDGEDGADAYPAARAMAEVAASTEDGR